MLAGGTGVPRDPSLWQFEPKFDGQRIMATVTAGEVVLTNRRGLDTSPTYPELLTVPEALVGRAAVFDGEVVTLDEAGRPSFQRLQRRMHVTRPPARLVTDTPVIFAVFDLLWLDGVSLVERSQRERRALLEALGPLGGPWQTAPLLTSPPADLLEACREVGLEGFMAKRLEAAYLPGKRSAAWSKIKCGRRREFVVGGWSTGKGSRRSGIGSLALGYFDQGALVYVGQAGSGLTEDLIAELRALFDKTERPTSAFGQPVPAGIRFVEPLLVVEVAFSEVTESGTLRQPSLKGIRTDLVATDVVADADFSPGQ